jgi:hypothetical protein
MQSTNLGVFLTHGKTKTFLSRTQDTMRFVFSTKDEQRSLTKRKENQMHNARYRSKRENGEDILILDPVSRDFQYYSVGLADLEENIALSLKRVGQQARMESLTGD